jgi:hypothetical protein
MDASATIIAFGKTIPSKHVADALSSYKSGKLTDTIIL